MIRKQAVCQLYSSSFLSLLLLTATVPTAPQLLPQSGSLKNASQTESSRWLGVDASQVSETAAVSRPDQQFMMMMVPYQEDAIALANAALTRAQHPEIKALARTIKQAQATRNQQLRSFYRQWYGTDVPDSLQGQEMANSNQKLNGMGGALQIDLMDLELSPDFDQAFLEEMMQHQQMGVIMAQEVLASSDRSEIRTFAKSVIQTQNAHIDEMQYWYQQWYLAGNREP
ncbi:MAG: DUF305 domain-containing protein [Oscillatoriales cyanobacterium C42_A2020_001]|nr:DUF305 domain-containing protein [Leptolyngbyaceae cyanobacterium C42_A2020_001]